MRQILQLFIIVLCGITIQVTLLSQEKLDKIVKPQYANTPNKDFIADAPWRVQSETTKIPIIVTIKDADQWNCQLKKITIKNVNNSNTIYSYIPPSPGYITITKPRWEKIFQDKSAYDLGIPSGNYLSIKVEMITSDWPYIIEDTFIQRLRIFISDGKFPTFDYWYHGDTHFHSEFTDNVYEFGASMNAISRATSAMGLDWLTITDHSCDFDSGGIIFNHLQDSLNKYNPVSSCQLICGEEITLDNNNTNEDPDEKIHFLVYPNNFIRGPENIVSGITPTRDASHILTTLSKALSKLSAGFAYAAHPSDAITSPIGNIKQWSASNYTIAFANIRFIGLESWNEKIMLKTDGLNTMNINPFPWQVSNFNNYKSMLASAINLWQSKLTSNLSPLRKIFLSGGSDAHGDFNYSTSNAGTTISASDNAIAKIRTVAYCPNSMGTTNENLLQAFSNGNTIVTDGPVLIFNIDINGDGIIDSRDAVIGDHNICSKNLIDSGKIGIQIKWKNTIEFGGNIKSMKLFYNTNSYELIGKFGITESKEGEAIVSLKAIRDEFNISYITQQFSFFRLEAYTLGDTFRCYTNPVWLNIDTTITFLEEKSNLPNDFILSQNFPNPFNPSTKISFELPITAMVSLKIFNVLGQEVAELINEKREAGRYEQVFNASKLGSGVYFYRLSVSPSATRDLVSTSRDGQAEIFTDVKKMLIIK